MLILWLAGLAAVAAWSAQARVTPWTGAAAVFAVLASGLAALAHWRRPPRQASLAWGGATWTLCEPPSEREGTLAPALDLQGVMLLRWQPHTGGAARWLWVQQDANPSGWDDLRRAVYSRASPDAAPGAQPPAAHS